MKLCNLLSTPILTVLLNSKRLINSINRGKLINKIRKRGLRLTQRTFGNTDNQFFILSSEGIRQAEYILDTVIQKLLVFCFYVTCCNQLLNMQTMEKNRLQIMPKRFAMIIKPVQNLIKNQIIKIEEK
jgi:hypothetical protein